MFVRLIRTIGKGAKAVHTVRLKIDRTMHGRYSATMLSLLFSFLASIAIAYPLFVPPYVGFANDGSLDYVMQDTSLAQLPGSGYFDYYERTLRIVSHSYAPGTTPWPQVGAIRLAMAVDFAISGDSLFDLRALALIYTLMYIPAVFWTIRLAVQSTRTFIDGVLIAALGALILSDVNLVARFASLYAQPLELILSLYAISGLIAIARKRGGYVLHLLVAAALWLLSQVNPSAGASLFAVSALFVAFATRASTAGSRAMCVIFAVLLGLTGITSLAQLRFQQTDAQKYNAMTRGVLLTARNPEAALADFGMDARYATLTDTYAEQAVPYARLTSPALADGFFNKFTAGHVLAYYVSHPGAVLTMLDTGMRTAISVRPDYIGNFEMSAGRLPRAKAALVSLWSSFKIKSMPRTIGSLIVLVAAALFLMRKLRGTPGKPIMTVMLTLSGAMAIQWMAAAVMGGDTLVARQAAMTGNIVDMILYFEAAEAVHFLNLVRTEGKT